MTVLEQSAGSGRQCAKADRREGACLNCGVRFTRGARRPSFCSRKCVRAFNNRRMTRGAVLYDLVMVTRYERDAAKRHKVWRTINRLAARYRDEDHAERDGRRSWRSLHAVREAWISLWAE